MRIAVYPGSFDPITFGHLDVVRRATEVFDRVVVAVLVNTRKVPTQTGEDRVRVIRESVREAGLDQQDRVHVMTFEGLTVELARAVGARHIVRGLRATSDFESELQMAHMNHRMAPEVDTVFFAGATGPIPVPEDDIEFDSETQITVLVPAGAITGKITVVGPEGIGSSPKKFKVLASPVSTTTTSGSTPSSTTTGPPTTTTTGG